MGTKNNPGKFDCHSKALPDEPTFTICARDPDFERLVKDWAINRQRAIFNGDRPEDDHAMVEEAIETAIDGSRWRKNNMGKWRKQ
jgi:hypothetical protein